MKKEKSFEQFMEFSAALTLIGLSDKQAEEVMKLSGHHSGSLAKVLDYVSMYVEVGTVASDDATVLYRPKDSVEVTLDLFGNKNVSDEEWRNPRTYLIDAPKRKGRIVCTGADGKTGRSITKLVSLAELEQLNQSASGEHYALELVDAPAAQAKIVGIVPDIQARIERTYQEKARKKQIEDQVWSKKGAIAQQLRGFKPQPAAAKTTSAKKPVMA